MWQFLHRERATVSFLYDWILIDKLSAKTYLEILYRLSTNIEKLLWLYCYNSLNTINWLDRLNFLTLQKCNRCSILNGKKNVFVSGFRTTVVHGTWKHSQVIYSMISELTNLNRKLAKMTNLHHIIMTNIT